MKSSPKPNPKAKPMKQLVITIDRDVPPPTRIHHIHQMRQAIGELKAGESFAISVEGYANAKSCLGAVYKQVKDWRKLHDTDKQAIFTARIQAGEQTVRCWRLK